MNDTKSTNYYNETTRIFKRQFTEKLNIDNSHTTTATNRYIDTNKHTNICVHRPITSRSWFKYVSYTNINNYAPTESKQTNCM